MWTKVLIVLLIIPLILGPGCVVTGWILPLDNHSSVTLGGLAKEHPEPGSRGYRASVVWGFIGDCLWIPIFGIGLLWWAIDILYLWVMGGGYSARWYAAYGHTNDGNYDDEYDDSYDDGYGSRRDDRRRRE